MKYVLEVCLIVANMLAAVPANAQTATPTMQKGISVELPVAGHAVPQPDADRADALVVTITRVGAAYVGTEPISPEVLKVQLSKAGPRRVYIKADGRTPFANVVKVLDAVQAAGVEPVLLTGGQRVSSGSVVPPYGLAFGRAD